MARKSSEEVKEVVVPEVVVEQPVQEVSEEAKIEEAVKDIAPQPVALTSDKFALELREDGYYNVRSRDTNQLLIVGVSEEDVLAQYV